MADRRENTPAPPVGDLQSDLTEGVDLDAIISEILTDPSQLEADPGLFASSEEVSPSLNLHSGQEVTSDDIPVTLSQVTSHFREVEIVPVTETGMAPISEYVTSVDVDLRTPSSWTVVTVGDSDTLREEDILPFTIPMHDESQSTLDETSQILSSGTDPEQQTSVIPSIDISTLAAAGREHFVVGATPLSAGVQVQPETTSGILQYPDPSALTHSESDPMLESQALVASFTPEAPLNLLYLEETGLLPKGSSTGGVRPKKRREPFRRRTAASSTVTGPRSGSGEHPHTGRNPNVEFEATSLEERGIKEFVENVPLDVLYSERALGTTQEDPRPTSRTVQSPTIRRQPSQEERQLSEGPSFPPQEPLPTHLVLSSSVSEATPSASSSSVADLRQTMGRKPSLIHDIRDVIVKYAMSSSRSSSSRTLSHPQTTIRRASPPTRFLFPPVQFGPDSSSSPRVSPASTTSSPSSATSPLTGGETRGQGRSSSESYVRERLHERLRQRRDSLIVDESQIEERGDTATVRVQFTDSRFENA
ncbi:hypothetical protein LSH36_177g01034 [Paralvinella palmiformis]|uniref:Uncharacterized protein n=1 Tax=Paralvinella palmiformis TaxID=53620 RepID=A0AAD9JSG4_9ANNE|nr:hypothetical protein LSH36_177g01034 [Paralvinella palmiformis]